MAKEYIERGTLALKVRRHLMPNVDIDGTVSVEDAERYFLKLLDEQPAADVVEVVHGEWLDHADPIDAQFGRMDLKCSKCGMFADNFIGGTENWWCGKKTNFCPNCGAKMDGKDGEGK